MVDIPLGEPVTLIPAAAVGDKDQRICLGPVISGGQIYTGALRVPVRIRVGLEGDGPGPVRVPDGDPCAFPAGAHKQLAVRLGSGHGGNNGRILRIGDPLVDPAFKSRTQQFSKIGETQFRSGFCHHIAPGIFFVFLTELRVDDKLIGIDTGRKRQNGFIDPLSVPLQFFVVNTADGGHAFLILGRRELLFTIDHSSLIRVAGQAAFIKQELALQRCAVHTDARHVLWIQCDLHRIKICHFDTSFASDCLLLPCSLYGRAWGKSTNGMLVFDQIGEGKSGSCTPPERPGRASDLNRMTVLAEQMDSFGSCAGDILQT